MEILKRYLYYTTLVILFLLFGANSYAQTYTYDWRPISGTWALKNNWQSTNNSTGVVSYPAATYPGLNSTDIVRIGVNNSISAFGNQPIITSGVTYTVASLTFGNNNAAVGATGNLSLTIGAGSILTVTGTVLQMHSSTGGATNSGGRDPVDCYSCYTTAINTSITGPGTLHCSYITVGDNTIPANMYVNNNTYLFIKGSVVINVDNDFTLNSASYYFDADSTVISRNSNANVSFQSGTVTINGQLKETNYNPYHYVVEQYIPITCFSMDLYKNANSPILNLGGTTPLNISLGGYYCNNSVDFYNVNQSGGTGQCYVNYTGSGNQVVYNESSFAVYALDADPDVYQNLGFGGSGTKTFNTGATTISGNITLNPGSETLDLSTNNISSITGTLNIGAGATLKQGSGDISVTGAITNAGTLSLGTGNFYISGNFNNSGTYTQGTGTTYFNGSSAQSLTSSSNTLFKTLVFNGNNAVTMASGSNFSMASTSVLTMSGSSTSLNANGALTLISDANGTATVAAIPSGSSITGNVIAQRYVQANRAYRLVSSPVYTSTVSSNKVYSINYLLGDSYLTGSGGVAGGFSKAGNPTLYLYRENLAPLTTSFTNSNFRGIANISAAPTYTLDVDGGPYNIPVGNGFLFYYRGSSKQKTLAALTVAGATATNDTLAATGTLNQGSITVHHWYTPASANLMYTTASGDVTVEGMNLVGNPYPSSIDWDKFSNSNSGAPIYGYHMGTSCYELVPTGAQGSGNYNVYAAGSGGIGTQGTANSNIIASGEGFFVKAADATAQLTFNESAKSNTQVTGASLYMGKPVAVNNLQLLRLQLAMDSINTDGMIIRFSDNAKTTFDALEDAQYRTGTGKVTLASFSSDHVALAINQLPLSLKGDTIKLRVTASTSGTYTLSLKNIVGIPQVYDIWLKDALTKDSVNLRNTATYSFTVTTTDTTTFGANRFMIVMAQDPAFAYKLLSFNADKTGQGRQVQIGWKTANEQNYTHFTVERSNDNGKTFEVAGGMLSSGSGEYGLTDRNAQKGDNLYRLKQEDFNNTITYSNVVDIQFQDNGNNKSGSISCYPNPAVNAIHLAIVPKSQGNTTYDIKITNSSGMVVKYATVTDTNWQDNISNLLTGTYLVLVTDKKDNSVVGQAKFVKL